MKTALEEIKNKIANLNGYDDWESMWNNDYGLCVENFDLIVKIYSNKKLDDAAKTATVIYHNGHNKSESVMKQVNIGADHIKANKNAIIALKDKV